LCVLQQQVPLPLPCFNFAQITTPSITPLVTTTRPYLNNLIFSNLLKLRC